MNISQRVAEVERPSFTPFVEMLLVAALTIGFAAALGSIVLI